MTTYVLHGHHNTLVSDYDTHREAMERLDYIRSGGKPATETPTRLRLIRILTDDEATDFLAVRKAYNEAVASARKAYDEASERWHRSVCVPDCPWDGQTIFPGAAR